MKKRLNEDISITDPQLAQQWAIGMRKLAEFDQKAADLKGQISKIEQQKSMVQKEMAKISAKSSPEESQQTQQTQPEGTTTVQVTGQQVPGANESLIEAINPAMDEEDRINLEIDQLADQIVYYQEHYDGDEETKEEVINDLMTDMAELQNQLKELEMDQMEHEDLYDPQERWDLDQHMDLGEYPIDEAYGDYPAAMYEGFASEFRPKRDLVWKGQQYYIGSVENVNDKLDIVYLYGPGMQEGKMMSSKHLEADGAEMVQKEKKQREKRMTKREYESMLKGAMSDLGQDFEQGHSEVYDMAQSIIMDPEVEEYLERKWKKENYDGWFSPEPRKNDLLDQLVVDLEMFAESFTPSTKKNFRLVSEAFAEMQDKGRDEDEFLDEPYVFYVKINEDGKEFIGKIFKVSPDGDWFGKIKKGESDTFNKISYEPEYDEVDIVKFLSENYDFVEIIDRHEFNDFIEDELDTRTKEEGIGDEVLDTRTMEEGPEEEVEESWPMNTVGSSGPITRY